MQDHLFCMNVFDDAARVADRDGVGRDIAGYNGACTYGAVVADSYARQNCNRAAYPAVVADGYRFCPFPSAVALYGVNAMASGIDRHIRTYKSVITDGNIRLVKHCKMEISEKTLANTYLRTIIAIKGLIDKHIVIACAKQFFQEGFPFFQLRGAQVVVVKD